MVHLSNIEFGKKTLGLSTLIRIAGALDVATDWILHAETSSTYAVANEKNGALFANCTNAEIESILRISEEVKEPCAITEYTVVKNLTVEAKDTTKTDASYRTYPLLPEAADLLRPLRAGQPLTGYVFHRDGGRYLRPDTLTKGFQKALRQHGLPRLRFHDLRHATASILFDEGWSVPDVQHWLGHADIETTMNIYAAYNSTRKLKVGGALAELLEQP